MGQNGRPAGDDELILALAARDVAPKGRNNAARGNAPGNETITTMDQPRRGAINGEQWMASRGSERCPAMFISPRCGYENGARTRFQGRCPWL
jgi:hypothetical protein